MLAWWRSGFYIIHQAFHGISCSPVGNSHLSFGENEHRGTQGPLESAQGFIRKEIDGFFRALLDVGSPFPAERRRRPSEAKHNAEEACTAVTGDKAADHLLHRVEDRRSTHYSATNIMEVLIRGRATEGSLCLLSLRSVTA